MNRKVAIVFEREFGDRLGELAMRMPVWIVESSTNNPAVAQAWNRATEWPQISVTVFRPHDDLRSLLPQIGHPQRVDIVGMALSDEARDTLMAAGFTKVSETRDGFRAT